MEIAGKPTHRWDQVTVGGGAATELAHDFTSGNLRIGATHGKRLIDATVTVRSAEAKSSVAGARTYTPAKSNPTSFILSSGRYEVAVTPVKPADGARQALTVTIESGGSSENILDFAAPAAQ